MVETVAWMDSHRVWAAVGAPVDGGPHALVLRDEFDDIVRRCEELRELLREAVEYRTGLAYEYKLLDRIAAELARGDR